MTCPLRQRPGHAHGPQKYSFIDALRGYAVLMVITSHTGGIFPELPYPLKKLTNFGWNGVQLFFLTSCVTLLLSWHSDKVEGSTDIVAFWTRRFFRIAPLYYLAAAFYFFFEPPTGGFDLIQLLTSLTFVNAWHPMLIPTTLQKWMVVPGGWSIGVEVTFYILFPLIAVWVQTRRAAYVFVAVAILVGSVANSFAYMPLVKAYGETATANFLYYWFPNQLAVFALGTVLFYTLQKLWEEPETRYRVLLRTHAKKIVLTCIAGCIAAANIPFPERLPFAKPFVMPTFLIAALIFMLFTVTVGNAPDNIFLNRPIRSLGKVSFSAYIVHFAVLHRMVALLPPAFGKNARDWRAILACFVLWIIAVLMTYCISLVTFVAIEEPMIRLGRRVVARLRGNTTLSVKQT